MLRELGLSLGELPPTAILFDPWAIFFGKTLTDTIVLMQNLRDVSHLPQK